MLFCITPIGFKNMECFEVINIFLLMASYVPYPIFWNKTILILIKIDMITGVLTLTRRTVQLKGNLILMGNTHMCPLEVTCM